MNNLQKFCGIHHHWMDDSFLSSIFASSSVVYSEDSEDLSSTISPNSAIITGRTYFLDRCLLGNSASDSLIRGSSDIEALSYGSLLGNSASDSLIHGSSDIEALLYGLLLGNSASDSLIRGSSDIEALLYSSSLGNSALSVRCTSVLSESSSSESWLISWIVFVRGSTNCPLHSEQLHATNLSIRDDVG
ncbi:unnamed protein product [Rhizophagus irregularis]|nr:unnamed protein product [Rhizophagus irregularis]